MPFFQQLRFLPSVLSWTERYLLIAFVTLFVAGAVFISVDAYLDATTVVPAEGGTYQEGIHGELRIINPLYASSDTERDIVELLFSGLLKHTANGVLQPALASGYSVSEDGTTYTFKLKKGLEWSDGRPLTAEDVVWTVQTMQDPQYQSARLADWLDVRVEKEDKHTVRFHLKQPYYSFPELATFKVLPKHVWQDVPPQNFHLSPHNIRPVTSGPYVVSEIQQDELGFIKTLKLQQNEHYYGTEPHIPRVTLRFFESERVIRENSHSLDGFALQPPVTSSPPRFVEHTATIPRYFAVFLNQKQADVLEQPNIRRALRFATDKRTLVTEALQGQGDPIHTPLSDTALPTVTATTSSNGAATSTYDLAQAKILLEEAGYNTVTEAGIRTKTMETDVQFKFTADLSRGDEGEQVRELQNCLAQYEDVYPSGTVSGYFGSKTAEAVTAFQEKYSEAILEPHGLTNGTGNVRGTTREKLNELCARISTEKQPLEFTLVTVDQQQLTRTANILKKQWKKAGVRLTIDTLSLSDLTQNRIKPRNYQMLLFGHVLGTHPDLYPFWHSSQVQEPGLNLARYSNNKTDEAITAARRATSQQEYRSATETLRATLAEDVPAIFLYNPDYLYYLRPKVKGVSPDILADPSLRFTNIENWFIKTRRVWE